MYKIIFTNQADKFLKKHKELENKIIEIFTFIIKNPFKNSKIFDIKAMQGLKNYYRLRINDYRVIYQIKNDELVILIVKIGNRGDIYKKGGV